MSNVQCPITTVLDVRILQCGRALVSSNSVLHVIRVHVQHFLNYYLLHDSTFHPGQLFVWVIVICLALSRVQLV